MKQSLLLFSRLHPIRTLFTRPLFAFSEIGAAEKTLLSKRLSENESKLKEMFSQVTESTNFSEALPLIEESISLKKKFSGKKRAKYMLITLIWASSKLLRANIKSLFIISNSHWRAIQLWHTPSKSRQV